MKELRFCYISSYNIWTVVMCMLFPCLCTHLGNSFRFNRRLPWCFDGRATGDFAQVETSAISLTRHETAFLIFFYLWSCRCNFSWWSLSVK